MICSNIVPKGKWKFSDQKNAVKVAEVPLFTSERANCGRTTEDELRDTREQHTTKAIDAGKEGTAQAQAG